MPQQYRHLDSRIEITKEKYPQFSQEMCGDPVSTALAAGWKLHSMNGRVTYISLSHPIDAINEAFINILAKYARPGDWIALQPGDEIPVQCHLILFDLSGNWSISNLLWCNHAKFLHLHQQLFEAESERSSASIAHGTDSWQFGDADQQVVQIEDSIKIISKKLTEHFSQQKG